MIQYIYRATWIYVYILYQLQWPCGLRRGSVAALLLEWRVRIPPGPWLSLVSVVRCQVEVCVWMAALHRCPTDCGVYNRVWSWSPASLGAVVPWEKHILIDISGHKKKTWVVTDGQLTDTCMIMSIDWTVACWGTSRLLWYNMLIGFGIGFLVLWQTLRIVTWLVLLSVCLLLLD
jgi:hypothetical protein